MDAGGLPGVLGRLPWEPGAYLLHLEDGWEYNAESRGRNEGPQSDGMKDHKLMVTDGSRHPRTQGRDISDGGLVSNHI